MEALHDVDVGAVNLIERPHLVLAVLERALLVLCKLLSERL
jgi:hypothetical protein